MKLIQKYTGILRTFKCLYVLNNILNYKKLSHNKEAYRKLGIKKFIFSNISSKDFENKPLNPNWLDKEGASIQLKNNKDLQSFPSQIQEKIQKWPEDGFVILENFFNNDQIENINAEIDLLLNKNKVDFNYTNRKIMFAFKRSKVIKDIANDSKLVKILNFLLNRKVILFQTINFIKGSEQKAHSDSIHMTTYPLGNLIAVWIALEDTNSENGPLFYYPGSHKLPYVLNKDFNSGNTKYQIGNQAYKNYEKKLAEVIKENNLEKVDFFAKKGDVFIWHANLIHGGNIVLNPNLTRKSMVMHYFCEDVICYHEITERPALFDSYPKSSVQLYEEED